MNTLRNAGISALAVLLAVAEVLALVFTAVVVTLVIVVAFVARAFAEASEHRRIRHGRAGATAVSA